MIGRVVAMRKRLVFSEPWQRASTNLNPMPGRSWSCHTRTTRTLLPQC